MSAHSARLASKSRRGDSRGLFSPAPMSKPEPTDPSEIALRSLLRRVVVIAVATVVVMAAFIIAWCVGWFEPRR